MKKLMSLVMAAVMVFGCFGAVYADEALESLTLSVKTKLQIPEEYTELNTSRRQTEAGEVVSFEWRNEDNEWINAEATSDGIITDYSNSKIDLENGISKYTAEEAAALANDWMKKINPDIASEYVFTAENVRLGYGMRVSADRYINGARVDGNYAHISMNSRTGEVSYCYLRYDKYDFDKAEGIISYDEAAVRFGEKTNLILAYMNIGNGKAIPVYVNFEGRYEEKFGVDAFTGEYAEYQRKYYRTSGGSKNYMAEMAEDAAVEGNMKLTEKEIAEISKYDNCISKEEAAAVIKNVKEFGTADYTLESAVYEKWMSYENGEETELGIIVTVYLSGETEDAYAALNAETGEILEFSCYRKEGEQSVTDEQMKKTADEVAAKIFKDRKYINAVSTDGQFVYLEEVNSIPYIDSNASITIDKTTGYVTNLYTDWEKDEIEFAPYEEAIANNMAHKIYLSESEYELVYQDIYGSDAMPLYKIEMTDSDEPVYKLLYLRKSTPYCINAITGNVNNAQGEEEKEKLTGFNDIEGHWSEKAIKALVDNGFLSVDKENFGPDENITAAEAQEMMHSADLYRYDIEKADDSYLQRDEAAKAIVCGAGYEKIGALSDIYIPVFADWNSIYEGNKGYVALAKAMGIVSGDQNGFFNPMGSVTKGAFAVMIYNYIVNGNMEY